MSHVRRTRLKQTKRFRCRDDVIYFFSSDNSIKYVNFDLITTHEYQKFMTSIGDDNTYTRFTIKSNLISIQTKGIHLFFVRFINQIIIFIADNYGLLTFFFVPPPCIPTRTKFANNKRIFKSSRNTSIVRKVKSFGAHGLQMINYNFSAYQNIACSHVRFRYFSSFHNYIVRNSCQSSCILRLKIHVTLSV